MLWISLSEKEFRATRSGPKGKGGDMWKNMRRMAFLIVGIVVAGLVGSPLAGAATGNQGYAVYRDGVFFGTNWHAAFMDDPHSNTTSLPVIHAPGTPGMVKFDSWSAFMGGKVYQGVYRPKVAPNSAMRDNFRTLARTLRSEAIPYSLGFQVYYDETSTTGTWVDPHEIQSMRCDGVIEYVFEWYGFRVFGSDSYRDVTKNSSANRNLHSGTQVSPKTQAQSYLTKVTSALP